MLTSTNACADGQGRPVFAAWFGNFFEPYFSDKQMVSDGIAELHALGFNSVALDSKLWSDFTRFFETGEASPYVAMQQFIIEECKKHGMGVSFLALFANGDNLWPTIYDNPPEYVEQPVDYEGNAYRGYRHWSEKQLDAHVAHSLNLYRKLAGAQAATATDETGAERLPFYFYHSPIFAPCFDEDGIAHYKAWLKGQYTVEEVNARYGTSFASIDDMTPPDYWTYPGHELAGTPSPKDYAANSPVLLKYADNQRYKQQTMAAYFAKLCARMKEADPRFYLYAGLSQWKVFFSDFVHIQNRGWDLWDLGKSLDSPTFLTLPVDTAGDPVLYVVPCELAMLRSAAREDSFVAGLFVGRYCAVDIYGVFSPAEVLASTLGSGASDLYFYGYNGLDDGGNFGKWPASHKQSLKEGLDWFSAVRARCGKRVVDKKAAILFPYASYTLTAPNGDWTSYEAFRNDLLGWYRQLADHGINADILHPSQVRAGALAGYDMVVLPADPLYWVMPDSEMEGALGAYVQAGGKVLHSPSPLACAAFGIVSQPHAPDSFRCGETVVASSAEFVSFPDGTPHGTYVSDGTSAITTRTMGKGTVLSFGFYYGQAYTAKEHLPVPRQYGKQNHYPLTVIAETPVDRYLAEWGLSAGRERDIERIPFQNGTVIVNHTPYTYVLPQPAEDAICTFPGFDGTHLPGRHAVFVASQA